MKKGEIVTDYFARIEESKDTDEISIDELQSSLVMHEQKFNRVNKEEDDHVLKVEEISNRGRGRGRGSSRGCGGRVQERNYFNKATFECYKCHGLRQIQYECPKWNNE
ncbi:hypothetical protein KIW84_057558 [Lathyrus oleraceus]|uniref:Uncharacterized protein n=1 Tax=Pisum sativum TaxID=3888 RepID=A0A9D4X687_PEA|nr:hypothetical protein KIW84_057558 [Pisum sativum]